MLLKDNTYKVMKLFFDSPERRFHIREMARLTKLSTTAITKIVGKLKKEGLLMSMKTKMVEEVHFLRTDKTLLLKRCDNLQRLFESGLVKFLKDEYEEPEAIVLFGSYSKGEDISTSDIDIAVVTKKELKLDLKRFERILKRKVSIYEIQIRTAEKDFLNSLANGIVLCGYLKVLE